MKLLLTLLLLPLVFSCSSWRHARNYTSEHSSLQTWTVTDGVEFELQDAGPSWYSVDFPCLEKCDTACGHAVQMMVKQATLIKGSCSVSRPSSTKIDTVSLLTAEQAKNADWCVSWNVSNQQELSISLIDPIIIVSVDSSLSFELREPDILTANHLMIKQEEALYEMNNLLNRNGFFQMVARMPNPTQIYNYPLDRVVSWLPRVCYNDGPALQEKSSDTIEIFQTGVTSGGQATVAWTTTIKHSDQASASSISFRRFDIATDSIFEQTTHALPSGIRLFQVLNWSEREEFTIWWNNTMNGKPLPPVMPADAGLATASGLLLGVVDIRSDMLAGEFPNFILILRTDALNQVGPTGQVISAFLSEPIK